MDPVFWINVAIPIATAIVGFFGHRMLPGGEPRPNPPGFDAADLDNIFAAVKEKIRQVRGGAVAPGQSTRPIIDSIVAIFTQPDQPPAPSQIPVPDILPGTQLDELVRKLADALLAKLKPTPKP